MKKFYFTLLAILFFSGIALFANPVDRQKAQQAAERFLMQQQEITAPVNQKVQATLRRQQAQPRIVKSRTTLALPHLQQNNSMLPHLQPGKRLNAAALQPAAQPLPLLKNVLSADTSAFYVFNRGNGQGFVIIAADDRITPVLAYAESGSFDENNLPPNVRWWLDGYRKQIRAAVQNSIAAAPETREAWNALLNGTSAIHRAPAATSAVTPLLTTTWDQSPYYNQLCPQGTPAGCAATAMAQIMKYWNCPAQGTGSHSYTSNYGMLSANFAATTYDWANMPAALTSSSSPTQKTAVATLMYHCGVAVNMNYTPNGSYAQILSFGGYFQNCSETAFKNYFGYSASVQGVQRDNYSGNWISLLKTEIDASRPVLYAGFDDAATAGHAFVCDGYDANNYFHFNWGWSGWYNGYFLVNKLNPDGTGTGGGTGSYSYGQQILINLKPADGSTPPPANSYDIKLNSAVTVSPNPATYGSAYTISANIKNFGTTAFAGVTTAAIFDGNGDYTGVLSNEITASLGSNAAQNFTFTFNGTELSAGTYYAVITYADNNAEYLSIVADNGTYENLLQFTISGGSSANTQKIRLNSHISVSPNPVPVVSGVNAAFQVSATLKNVSDSAFQGECAVQILNSNYTSANAWYESAYCYPLTLNSGEETAVSIQLNAFQFPAGTYYVRLLYSEDGGTFPFVGNNGNYYQNLQPFTIGSGGAPAEAGVVINGVTWATRNVDAPGTFAASPESAGLFYQWNRNVGWSATGDVIGWDSSIPAGTEWEAANDPSPAGWRVPTSAEQQTLYNTTYVSSEWTTRNGVNGRLFTDKATGNTLFLPAAGNRSSVVGTLYGAGTDGCYWSSTQGSSTHAYYLNFYSSDAYWLNGGGRSNGFSVRSVWGNASGIEKVQAQDISIYPNPIKDVLHIKSEQPLENITIYDIAGVQMLSKVPLWGIEGASVNVSHLPAGIYLVKAGNKTAKFIKE